MDRRVSLVLRGSGLALFHFSGLAPQQCGAFFLEGTNPARPHLFLWEQFLSHQGTLPSVTFRKRVETDEGSWNPSLQLSHEANHLCHGRFRRMPNAVTTRARNMIHFGLLNGCGHQRRVRMKTICLRPK